uniref:Uncharacterized protein n=1 Tax=Rangifer tarandus platyrhynchus TaxID=3082113 RepID=A0ACB0EXA8_RANTA|nr:unnamed protein product [Rangifer tarandus platyrhynchus]
MGAHSSSRCQVTSIQRQVTEGVCLYVHTGDDYGFTSVMHGIHWHFESECDWHPDPCAYPQASHLLGFVLKGDALLSDDDKQDLHGSQERAGCLPVADLKPRTLGSTCPPAHCSSPTRSSESALQITAQKQAGWEEEKGLEKIDS